MSINAEVGASSPGGYSQVVPVDRDRLHDLGVSKSSCSQFVAVQNTAHLNVIEFFHALPYFPIAFVRQQNGNYSPCAVLGLNSGENLFLDADGNWQDDVYSPAYIRRYPFITEAITEEELKADDKDLRKPIFVDETALVKDAPALFIANGVATPEWQAIESFVSDYISAEQLTLSFTRKLNSLDLLEAFDAQVHPDQGDTIRLKGLYRVNENKLNSLPAKVIKDLMVSGELSRIYAHLISLENFAKLLDRSARRKQQ
ncbi:MAG: SapC family protein [Gammaproteobacteria bacterium]|nr:SapC family protein [Gammaproteobacteria bacterium]